MVSRSEFRRKASMANKRIKRMESQGFQSPAYKQMMKTGGKFSIKGLSGKDLERENARLDKFLGSKTSTVRGSKKVYKDMLSRTGIGDLLAGTDDVAGLGIITIEGPEDYESKNHGDMSAQAVISNFFDIASMVDEYLRNHRGVKLTSGEVWGSIVQEYLSDTDLSAISDPDEIVAKVIKRLHANYLKGKVASSGGFSEFK